MKIMLHFCKLILSRLLVLWVSIIQLMVIFVNTGKKNNLVDDKNDS